MVRNKTGKQCLVTDILRCVCLSVSLVLPKMLKPVPGSKITVLQRSGTGNLRDGEQQLCAALQKMGREGEFRAARYATADKAVLNCPFCPTPSA